MHLKCNGIITLVIAGLNHLVLYHNDPCVVILLAQGTNDAKVIKPEE